MIDAGKHMGLAYAMADRFNHKHRFDRDDLAQEAMLMVMKAARLYNPRRGKFSTYASKAIMRHLWQKYIVRAKPELAHLGGGGRNLADPDTVTDAHSVATDMWGFAERLATPRQREMLHLIYREHMTLQGVADRWGTSRQNVEGMHKKLLQKIRDAVGGETDTAVQ